MFEKVYLILGSIELLILLILIGKYIYFEKFFYYSRTWYFFGGTFLFSEVILSFFDQDGSIPVAAVFLFFSALVFISRKTQKIRGLFLTLPIAGILFSIISIPIAFKYLFSESMNSIIIINTSWMIIFDFIFWTGFILFLWRGSKWRRRFNEMLNNRTLSKWERGIINTAGLFFLLFFVLVLSVDEFSLTSLYASKIFIGFGIFIIAFFEMSIIAMVIQGNSKTYFQQTAIINEHYLNMQLQHFKTYQETQRETRRVHHDMKNHITCIHNLITEGKTEEVRSYILSLDSQIQQIDKELHTGNDIVDAIVNEKYAKAKNDQISISIEGKLGSLTVAAIDLCTLFSNAIDNAVEALKDNNVPEKEIQLTFKQQNQMQFFIFRNPVSPPKSPYTFLTTKKDSHNHGFGLDNIRMTVEKYQGQMNYYIENDGEHNFFILEIILFMQSTT